MVVKLRLSHSSNSTSDGELRRVGTCGVEKGGDPLVRPTSEFVGKHTVNLDPDLAHAGKRGAVCQQAGKGRAGDGGLRAENEVVGQLDLEFSCAGGARGGRHEIRPDCRC